MNESQLPKFLSAGAVVIAALVGFFGNQRISALEEQFRQRAASEEFLAEKLSNFYVPISTHLAVTQALFTRYNEPDISEAEREAIEHELLRHNTGVRERLVEGGIYLEPSESVDVELMVERLLEHYTQWETVYRLKHEYGVWTGSVFAGISAFGWRGFPSEMGVDRYFRNTTRRLRSQLHEIRDLEAHVESSRSSWESSGAMALTRQERRSTKLPDSDFQARNGSS